MTLLLHPPVSTWIDRKRREVREAESVSIQTNIATLTHELNIAQGALDKIRTIHRPDPTASWCVHCQWEWPCRTYVYAGGGA